MLNFSSYWGGCYLQLTWRGCLFKAQDLSTKVPAGSAFLTLFNAKRFHIHRHLLWFILHDSSDHSSYLYLCLSAGDAGVHLISSWHTCTYMSRGCSSVFGNPCCCSFMLHTSCVETSLLSNLSSPSLTAKTYNTTQRASCLIRPTSQPKGHLSIYSVKHLSIHSSQKHSSLSNLSPSPH